MRILILRLSSIGDCVLASPVVEALRDRYPDAQISWVVQAKSAPVVQGLPGLDEVIVWDADSHHVAGMWRAVRQTLQAPYDIAIDLQGLDKAALFMATSRAAKRISSSRARFFARFVGNAIADETHQLHAWKTYLRRVGLAGVPADAETRYFPRVPITAQNTAHFRRLLSDAGWQEKQPFFGLNLGTPTSPKTWPATHYARIAARLLEEYPDGYVMIFGAPSDSGSRDAFMAELQQLPAEARRVVDGVGELSLMDLAAAARDSAAFLTTDTGPMHVAAAAGAPMLALFGRSRVERTAPVHHPQNPPIRVLDAQDVTTERPTPMSALTVDMVWDELQTMIQSAGRASQVPVTLA